jgi:hypothetical protein
MITGFVLGLLLLYSPIIVWLVLFGFGLIPQLYYLIRYRSFSERLWRILHSIFKKYVLIWFCTICLMFIYDFARDLYWSIKTRNSLLF